MNYYEIQLSPIPNTEIVRDILASILANYGFESFEETASGMNAYIQERLYHEAMVQEVIESFPLEDTQIYFKTVWIEGKDWNEEWEKHFFQPIVIDDQCVIYSSFHKDVPTLPYPIVIDPKMAFGTGHHETTNLMLSFLLELDVQDQSFLDMGCGTAVLAILAAMKGAKPVTAIDIDDWAYSNALENIHLNNMNEILVYQGDATLLNGKKFDLIFANINRNILLEDMARYISCLNPQGRLYVSGFYRQDMEIIRKTCEKEGMQWINTTYKNDWTAAHFQKKM